LKSREDTLRVHLDTSFILPSLGIDVGKEVPKALKDLADAEAEIYYSSFSILESLWVAARVSTGATFDGDSFSLGLRSIIEGGRYRKVEEDSQVFNEALRLYTLGHKDVVDNIIYASSTRLKLKLLTLDDELREFIRERGLEDNLLSPDQILR